jgi:methyl-accepting chemotaxis protein
MSGDAASYRCPNDVAQRKRDVTSSIAAPEEELIEEHIRGRRTQLALNTTRYVMWSAGGLAGLTVLLWLVFRRYPQLLVFAGTVVVVAIGARLYPVFAGQRRHTLGIYVFLAAILLVAVVLPVLIPEIMLAVAIGYVFLIILGNMLLGPRDSRWLAVVCVLAFMVDVVVTSVLGFSCFAPLEQRVSTAVITAPSAFVLLGAVIVVRQLVREQEEALRQSQRASLEIEKRALTEKERRTYLQDTVQVYAEYMAEVGRGNLVRRLSLDKDGRKVEDPLVALGRSLNAMAEALQRTIGQIQEATGSLSSSAAEILAATMQQGAGANEQSAAITQTNTTVEEVKVIAEQVIVGAQEVSDGAQRTVRVSRQGQQALEDMIASMAQIKTRVETISENILSLSRRTQQIGDIIATVGEIASQSNLLALNASVEAARAGEQGKGFAVVAMEVRKLAQRSQEATAQVKAILSNIQKATAATVLATEEGVKGVDTGVKLAAQAGEVIGQLADAIDESAQVAARMAAGGHQQAAGMEQISVSMQNIDQAMVQSLASTQQAEKAAQDLNELAQSLTAIVQQYEL